MIIVIIVIMIKIIQKFTITILQILGYKTKRKKALQ